MTSTKPISLLRCVAALLVVALVVVPGCSRAQKGPKRNALKGQITLRGKPVRGGRIVFAPDSKKGNSGPGAIAFIREGEFATPPGHGVVSGPHVVDILGYDEDVDQSSDAEPTATVRRTLNVDLPADGGTHDFTL
jgi:hypothetical protein